MDGKEGGGRHLLRKCAKADRTWVWGLLVYKELASTVTMMVLGERGVRGII